MCTHTHAQTYNVSTRVHTDICDHLRHGFLEFVGQTFRFFPVIATILNSRDRIKNLKALKWFFKGKSASVESCASFIIVGTL